MYHSCFQAPVAHHPGMVPGHAPSPAQPDMANTGSPAQPATPGGMYSQVHGSPAHTGIGSPHAAAMQPRPGGPHPPGPSPGMHGLGPTVVPSPSSQPPPSVQSQDDALEYDRKVCSQCIGFYGLWMWFGECGEGQCML